MFVNYFLLLNQLAWRPTPFSIFQVTYWVNIDSLVCVCVKTASCFLDQHLHHHTMEAATFLAAVIGLGVDILPM